MTLVLHWQQWYFIAGIALNLMSIPYRADLGTKLVGTALTVASVYVLLSSGFFTGGMQ